MTLAAGTKLGPYEITGPLGAGGMGEVYKARDSRLGREVAIKVLPESLAESGEALARFEREAKAVAALSHPNILAIHDFGKDGGVSYAVMELLEGATLRERLAESAIPASKATDYARQIARGLAAAHDRGFVHRDLKPENLFVTRDGLVKILDFGLARRTAPFAADTGATASSTAPLRTQEGTVLGTAGYMSPEQIRGRTADHKSDLFSLGAVLYEMLAGRRAFQKDSPMDTMIAILQDDPPALSESGRNVPPELDEIVAHCLEKDPDDRFQTARDLAFALGVVLSERHARTPEPSRAGSGVLAAIPAPAPAGGQASIAVLPLRNLSSDPEADYFSDGMTEEIIGALSRIESLRVASRTSSFAFKGKDTDVRRIGQELGVRTVLEGSVRRAGQRLRVAAQLVDVGSGYQLWSERFDRELEDVFAVQDEIARAIAETLKVRLLGSADAPLVAPAARDVEAYNHYLKGRYIWNRRQMREAAEEFEAAIARDPEYAAAYTGLADTYAVWGFYGGIPTWEAFGRARTAAERARQLEPDSAAVHLTFGMIEHYYGWDVAREERELKLAAEKDPRSADAFFWLALCLGTTDRFEGAREAGERAVALEPHSANARAALGWAYAGSRRYEEGIREFSVAVALDPQAVFPLWSLGHAQRQNGQLDAAIASLERVVSLSKREHCFELALLGDALGTAGRPEEAREILAELREKATRTYVPPFDLAVLLASLGESKDALAALERAYDERNALLWYRIHLPVFDSLRQEPRWQAVAEKLARTAPVTARRGS